MQSKTQEAELFAPVVAKKAEAKKEIAVKTEAQNIFEMISSAQANPDYQVDKLEKLFNLYERAKDREALSAYNEAIFRVRKAMPRITKSKRVMYDIEKGKPEKGQEEAFRFAPLEEIDKIVKPILLANDLVDSYDTESREGGGAVVITYLTHKLGHKGECKIPLPIDTSGGKNNTQGMGSTFSYGRRYGLCGILGIVVIGDDDDAASLTCISEEKALELEELLLQCEANLPMFLEFMNVNAIADIKKTDLKKAMNMINAKKRKLDQKKKETEQ